MNIPLSPKGRRDILKRRLIYDLGEMTMERERLIHFDLLRILACFSVVMLHSAAQSWYGLPVTSVDWLVINSYDAIVRFGVPIFVMISGALFLNNDKEINLKKLYTRNVLRLVVLYVVWSVIYGFLDCRANWSVIHIGDILREIFASQYHFWYLPMSVGLYMLVPILRKWLSVASKKEVEYFLGLFLVFQIVQTTMESIKMTEAMGFLWGTVDIEMACSYIGYFILGYYVVHYGIDKKLHKWLYLAGGLGAVANVVLGNYLAIKAGAPVGTVYDSFGIFTFLIVLALFVFFHEKVSAINFKKTSAKLIQEVSAATLGIYLMHVGIMGILSEYGIHSMMLMPVVGVPLLAIICFGVCFVLAAVLRRIPLIGRYLC